MIIEPSLKISSRIPAHEPTMISYMIHRGEFTNIPAIRILRALYVYPPMVDAIFAATGKRDIHPDQVIISVAICNVQIIMHIFLLRANSILLPRQNERKVFKI